MKGFYGNLDSAWTANEATNGRSRGFWRGIKRTTSLTTRYMVTITTYQVAVDEAHLEVDVYLTAWTLPPSPIQHGWVSPGVA